MKEDEFNEAVIDAVHSLEEIDQRIPRVYVFTKNTQAVRLAKIITGTVLLTTFILFLLFMIIIYS
tara:strand:+ start:278 stop:472 length:195 start_codon:yes stop_codon:yes gene_type:complete